MPYTFVLYCIAAALFLPSYCHVGGIRLSEDDLKQAQKGDGRILLGVITSDSDLIKQGVSEGGSVNAILQPYLGDMIYKLGTPHIDFPVCPALHLAINYARRDDIKTVILLLQLGADVNWHQLPDPAHRNRGFPPALLYGLGLGQVPSNNHAAVLQRLYNSFLKDRIDATRMEEWRAATGNPPLLQMTSLLGYFDSSYFLVSEYNAALDEKDSLGVTALHIAAWKNDIETAILLVYNGATVSPRDTYGRTPLHYASMRGNTELVRLLLAKLPSKDRPYRDMIPSWMITVKDKYGVTALDMAATRLPRMQLVVDIFEAVMDAEQKEEDAKSSDAKQSKEQLHAQTKFKISTSGLHPTQLIKSPTVRYNGSCALLCEIAAKRSSSISSSLKSSVIYSDSAVKDDTDWRWFTDTEFFNIHCGTMSSDSSSSSINSNDGTVNSYSSKHSAAYAQLCGSSDMITDASTFDGSFTTGSGGLITKVSSSSFIYTAGVKEKGKKGSPKGDYKDGTSLSRTTSTGSGGNKEFSYQFNSPLAIDEIGDSASLDQDTFIRKYVHEQRPVIIRASSHEKQQQQQHSQKQQQQKLRQLQGGNGLLSGQSIWAYAPDKEHFLQKYGDIKVKFGEGMYEPECCAFSKDNTLIDTGESEEVKTERRRRESLHALTRSTFDLSLKEYVRRYMNWPYKNINSTTGNGNTSSRTGTTSTSTAAASSSDTATATATATASSASSASTNAKETSSTSSTGAASIISARDKQTGNKPTAVASAASISTPVSATIPNDTPTVSRKSSSSSSSSSSRFNAWEARADDASEQLAGRLLQDVARPSLFDVCGSHDREPMKLSIGSDLSGEPMHRLNASWHVLLVGVKKWFIIAPGMGENATTAAPNSAKRAMQAQATEYGATTNIGTAPAAAAASSSATVLPTIDWIGQRHPERLRRDQVMAEVTQFPGDILFIPHDWAHASINLADSVSISQEICTFRNSDIRVQPLGLALYGGDDEHRGIGQFKTHTQTRVKPGVKVEKSESKIPNFFN